MIRNVNGRYVRILGNFGLVDAGPPTQLLYLNSIPNSSISNGFGTPNFGKLLPDVIVFRALFTKTGTTSGLTIRLYWNTAVDVNGATQLATFQTLNTSTYIQFSRKIFFEFGDTARIMNFTYDSNDDVGDFSTTHSRINIPNWSTQTGFFFLTCDSVGPFATDVIKKVYFSAEI